jgi:hypothetical protein
MFVDDPLEHRRIASSIPRAFRINNGDRAALADAETIRFGAENAAGLGQAQLLEPFLQKFPRDDRSVAVATFRVGLIGAQKDVPPRVRYAHRRSEILQAWQFVGWHMINDEDA